MRCEVLVPGIYKVITVLGLHYTLYGEEGESEGGKGKFLLVVSVCPRVNNLDFWQGRSQGLMPLGQTRTFPVAPQPLQHFSLAEFQEFLSTPTNTIQVFYLFNSIF